MKRILSLLLALFLLLLSGCKEKPDLSGLPELELLEEDGNGQMLAQADGQGAADAGFPTLRMHYDDDLNPAPEGTVWMDIQWIPASGQDGDGASPEEGLVKSVITVSRAGAQEPVYRLETEVFTGLDLSRDGF